MCACVYNAVDTEPNDVSSALVLCRDANPDWRGKCGELECEADWPVSWLNRKRKFLHLSNEKKSSKPTKFLFANETYMLENKRMCTHHFNWVVSLHAHSLARSTFLSLSLAQHDSVVRAACFFSISILNALRQLTNVECNSTQIRHTKIEPWNQN